MAHKIYLHEEVHIVGMNRPAYFEHITANWGHIAREERNLLCVGVWGVVGSTGPWIEVVNLWELDGWHGLAKNLAHETSTGTMMDPSLTDWWRIAAGYRRSGFDRLLIPASYSPTLAEALNNDLSAPVYYQEKVRLRPRTAEPYLDLLEQHWLPVAPQLGMRLVGAYRTAMRLDDEVVLIWAADSWESWADFETGREHRPEFADWAARADPLVVETRNVLMCPAPLCPVATGKQL